MVLRRRVHACSIGLVGYLLVPARAPYLGIAGLFEATE